MFGNSKNEPKGKTNGIIASASSSSSNSLIQGTNIEGSILADNDIRIDGSLRGNLNCKGKVIIGPTGFISGEVQCENAVIEGNFEGFLFVSDVLHIKETAKVEGDVTTQKLIVQPGSVFNVKCKMGAQSNVSRKVSLDEDDAMKTESVGASKASMS